MKKEIVLVDVDDVVCYNGIMDALNTFMGTNFLLTDFKEYFIEEEALKNDKKALAEFYEYLKTVDIYKNATLLPKAYEILKEMNELYDVRMLSACVMFGLEKNSGPHFMQKYEFLMRTLPFLDPNKFIFTNSKDNICGFVQIDDRMSNFNKHVKEKYLFKSYHNLELDKTLLDLYNITRVDDWEDIGRRLIRK